MTSRAHIGQLTKESALALVLEPALLDGSLKAWRKELESPGQEARGHAAHAGGDREKGRNAIEEMAHQVIAIQKLTDYSDANNAERGRDKRRHGLDVLSPGRSRHSSGCAR